MPTAPKRDPPSLGCATLLAIPNFCEFSFSACGGSQWLNRSRKAASQWPAEHSDTSEDLTETYGDLATSAFDFAFSF